MKETAAKSNNEQLIWRLLSPQRLCFRRNNKEQIDTINSNSLAKVNYSFRGNVSPILNHNLKVPVLASIDSDSTDKLFTDNNDNLCDSTSAAFSSN